jgi:hypothetical protein
MRNTTNITSPRRERVQQTGEDLIAFRLCTIAGTGKLKRQVYKRLAAFFLRA